MISDFVFYLHSWGLNNIIQKIHGSNLCPSNVGEIIIFYFEGKPRHFIVKERIIDYNEHTIHYRVELFSEVDLKG